MPANPAVVFRSVGNVEVVEQPIAAPRNGEVLIKTTCSLISTGTETTLLGGGFGLAARQQDPLLPNVGYCNVGVVVEVGSGVDRTWLGQRVASRSFHAAYVTCTASETASSWRSGLMPIPAAVSDEQAAFTSLALTALNGIRRGRVTLGDSVVIVGLGLIGQLAVRLCVLAGARPIHAINRSPGRHRWLPSSPAVIAATSKPDRLVDVVIECAGQAQAIADAAALLRPQGRLVVLGSADAPGTFDFHALCNGPSIELIGAHVTSHPPVATPDRPWSAVANGRFFLESLARGDLRVDDLVSHRMPATEAAEAYRVARNHDEAMGVLLRWQ